MSGVAPMQAKDVLKAVGIHERKLNDGKEQAYIVAQNTALRIASVFMLCCAVLVLLWVQSSEEAASRRSQVLEEQMTMEKKTMLGGGTRRCFCYGPFMGQLQTLG